MIIPFVAQPIVQAQTIKTAITSGTTTSTTTPPAAPNSSGNRDRHHLKIPPLLFFKSTNQELHPHTQDVIEEEEEASLASITGNHQHKEEEENQYTSPATLVYPQLVRHFFSAVASSSAVISGIETAAPTTATCNETQVSFLLELKSDDYPGEISWVLEDINKAKIIQQGNGYTNNTYSAHTIYNQTICIQKEACVKFTIEDSYGDGICCSHGNGYYNISYDDVLIKSAGNYGSNDTVTFGDACPSSPEETQEECEMVDFDPLLFLSDEAINELELTGDTIDSWTTSTATADLSVDSMEVAPLYMAEFKDHCETAAGGSTFYATLSSTLDCPPGVFPEGVDATIGNHPVCVTKACDISMLEGIIPNSCGATFADEPQDIAPEETQECEMVDFDLTYSDEATHELYLAYVTVTSWVYRTATADLSVDFMEVAPLYMTERKDQCNVAGGNTFYLTYPTLGCLSAGFAVDLDGSIVNSPLCVTKVCYSSILEEKFPGCDGVTVTDEPRAPSTLSTPPPSASPSKPPSAYPTLAPTQLQCPAGEIEVLVLVTTDPYPGENSWSIDDTTGTTVRSRGPFDSANMTYSDDLCLDESMCYTFTILDSYGDGIVGEDGNFTLTVDGVVALTNPTPGSWALLDKTFGNCSATPPSKTPPSTPPPEVSPSKPPSAYPTLAPVVQPPVHSTMPSLEPSSMPSEREYDGFTDFSTLSDEANAYCDDEANYYSETYGYVSVSLCVVACED
jgi:hypothetical protein